MPFEHTRQHPRWDPDRPRTVIRSLDEIPPFADECEEVALWDTHELSDELWDALSPLPDDEVARQERIRTKRQEQQTHRATG